MTENYIDETAKLLDIAQGNIEKQIRGNSCRTVEAKDENIEFLIDQRSARKMYISELLVMVMFLMTSNSKC